MKKTLSMIMAIAMVSNLAVPTVFATSDGNSVTIDKNEYEGNIDVTAETVGIPLEPYNPAQPASIDPNQCQQLKDCTKNLSENYRENSE